MVTRVNGGVVEGGCSAGALFGVRLGEVTGGAGIGGLDGLAEADGSVGQSRIALVSGARLFLAWVIIVRLAVWLVAACGAWRVVTCISCPAVAAWGACCRVAAWARLRAGRA